MGVALLAEGVDRNEISEGLETLGFVALLAEGVDRNVSSDCASQQSGGRPPRGGRG